MLNMFLKWIIYSFVIIFIAWIVPGIEVDNFLSAMFVCVIISLINVFVKPFLQVISFPITFLTFGLFSFVLNAFLLMLAGWITPGFEVEGFLSALIGSILLALITYLVEKLLKTNN